MEAISDNRERLNLGKGTMKVSYTARKIDPNNDINGITAVYGLAYPDSSYTISPVSDRDFILSKSEEPNCRWIVITTPNGSNRKSENHYNSVITNSNLLSARNEENVIGSMFSEKEGSKINIYSLAIRPDHQRQKVLKSSFPKMISFLTNFDNEDKLTEINGDFRIMPDSLGSLIEFNKNGFSPLGFYINLHKSSKSYNIERESGFPECKFLTDKNQKMTLKFSSVIPEVKSLADLVSEGFKEKGHEIDNIKTFNGKRSFSAPAKPLRSVLSIFAGYSDRPNFSIDSKAEFTLNKYYSLTLNLASNDGRGEISMPKGSSSYKEISRILKGIIEEVSDKRWEKRFNKEIEPLRVINIETSTPSQQIACRDNGCFPSAVRPGYGTNGSQKHPLVHFTYLLGDKDKIIKDLDIAEVIIDESLKTLEKRREFSSVRREIAETVIKNAREAVKKRDS